MIDLDIGLITLFMFGGMFSLLLINVPLAFATGSIAVISGYLFWGPQAVNLFPSSVYGMVTDYVFVAVPMFIFMGAVLERSGITDHLYEAVYHWVGSVRGSLAMTTVLVSLIMSAMVGIIGAIIVSMALIALPAMLKRGYDRQLAMGSIMAGGSLGVLIPPSIMLIMYAVWAGLSVRRMFLGAIFPGLLLGALFIGYIALRAYLQPELAPALPEADRIPLREKIKYLKALILPAALVIFVLGSIFAGIATPTEASGIGAFGALICALVYKKMNWDLIKHACLSTLRLSAMVMWIGFGAVAFVSVYNALGGVNFVKNAMLSIPVEPWVLLIAMMAIILFLGMIIEWVGIIMLTVPIFLPIVTALEFDPLWFALLVCVNLQMDVLTPPFGFALFYMKGVAPKEVTTWEIYKSSFPFVGLQLTALILCILFPEIILFLPNLIM